MLWLIFGDRDMKCFAGRRWRRGGVLSAAIIVMIPLVLGNNAWKQDGGAGILKVPQNRYRNRADLPSRLRKILLTL
jgi:hypothetical protein